MGLILGGALLVVTGTDIVFSVNAIGPAILFGFLLAVGLLTVFLSLQLTTVATSTMFMSASVVISGIFGVLFLGDKLTIGKLAGTLILLGSMYLIVSNKEEKKKFTFKAFLACMGVMLTNGFGTIAILLFANGAPEVPESVFMFVAYIVDFVLLAIFYLLLRLRKGGKKEPVKFSKKLLAFGSFGAVSLFFNQQFSTAISDIFPTTILAPLNMGCNVFISVLVGLFLFKEKPSIKNIIGIVIAFLSLLMINFL